MGAPRKHPPQDILQIIERVVAGEGGSIAILARAVGVSTFLVSTWFDREEYGNLRETYDMAREAYMHKLYIELLQMSRTGKGNVAGIIYTLKAKFKQYDQPGSGKLVDVNVIQTNPVLVIRDSGTDEQWQAKLLAQQRALTQHAGSAPLQIEASTAPHGDAVASFAPADDLPAVYVPVNASEPIPAPVAPSWAAPVKQAVPVTAAPSYAPPGYNWQAQPTPAPIYAPEPTPSAPVAPMTAPRWRGRA
jgi:hypothetical protein